MRTTRLALSLLFASSLSLAACGDDGGDGDGGDDILPPDATFFVRGEVIDLETGEPLDGTASVLVEGLESTPTVSVTGATFEIEVPANSAFHLLASSPPTYRATYNAAIEVGAEDVEGLQLVTVSEDYLTTLAEAFAVTPASGTGIIFLRLVDDTGAPLAGVPGADLLAPDGALGPFFLDADNLPDAEATASSSSGLAVFFDVSPGVTTLTSAPDAETALAAPDSPVASSTVSYIQALAGAPGEVIEVPSNVSLRDDVMPILAPCLGCHDGGGVGKDLGNLHFNGSGEKTYKELVEEISPKHQVARVNIDEPEASLMLTLPRCKATICPAPEGAPIDHPFATFTGPNDIRYLTILVWIQEGAQNN
ncbi:MAG: hypothetical protein KJO07_25695 [Deltaproteobacteria bacterium]|nr:hypothetical protein [Deltaproteobacteria bacterium]